MPEKQSLIKTDICKICFKKIEDFSFHRFLVNKPTICHHCFKESNPKFIKFVVNNIAALALYEYDDVIKNRLFQFKGCFDYELKDTFIEYYIWYLRIHYFNYVIVPAPSSKEHDTKRGFNHVCEMFKSLKLKMCPCIEKIGDRKQSDLSAKERQKISQFLTIKNGSQLTNKNVLIVDDVFTTGSTIRAMINLIKQQNPKKIKVVVLSKTIDESL